MDILSVAYFPPISYISLLGKGDVLLEAHENYQKQSWRNRANILSANGIEALQVPVIHSTKGTIMQTEVDYSRNFLVRHQRAIDSAYMSSAYFEYYRDELYAVMNAKPRTLWDLDMSIIGFFAKQLSLPMPALTPEFMGVNVDIHPKHPDPVYKEKPYYQVFSQKYGFVPNLSVMDLLFNEGPSAVDYL